jgi:hypothetical protein
LAEQLKIQSGFYGSSFSEAEQGATGEISGAEDSYF